MIDEAKAVQFLRSRRSIRLFKDKPVEKEKIQGLIEIARYAPTAGNSQLVEWLVFSDRNTVKEFAKLAAVRAWPPLLSGRNMNGVKKR